MKPLNPSPSICRASWSPASEAVPCIYLPGVGQIDWSVMMALADMLLGMIWTDITTEHRKRLFDRIASDIALGAAIA